MIFYFIRRTPITKKKGAKIKRSYMQAAVLRLSHSIKAVSSFVRTRWQDGDKEEHARVKQAISLLLVVFVVGRATSFGVVSSAPLVACGVATSTMMSRFYCKWKRQHAKYEIRPDRINLLGRVQGKIAQVCTSFPTPLPGESNNKGETEYVSIHSRISKTFTGASVVHLDASKLKIGEVMASINCLPDQHVSMLKLQDPVSIRVDGSPEINIKYVSHSAPTDAAVDVPTQMVVPLNYFDGVEDTSSCVRYTRHSNGLEVAVVRQPKKSSANVSLDYMKTHIITSQGTGRSFYVLEDRDLNLFAMAHMHNEPASELGSFVESGTEVHVPLGLSAVSTDRRHRVGSHVRNARFTSVSNALRGFDMYDKTSDAVLAAKSLTVVKLDENFSATIRRRSSGDMFTQIEKQSLFTRACDQVHTLMSSVFITSSIAYFAYSGGQMII